MLDSNIYNTYSQVASDPIVSNGGSADATGSRRSLATAQPATGSTGLSLSHNSAQVAYSLEGSLVKVTIPKGDRKKGGGIRGKITEFSKASKKRLIDTCHRVRRGQLPIFATLTYPADYPAVASEWKRHLDNFDRALDRISHGRIGAIWKLEPQQRGAPHYHLLIWGVKNIHRFRQWIALTWYRIVGSGDEKHLRAGTQADAVRSWRGVAAYAAKYMGKVVNNVGWDYPGRLWGVLNRDAIPWAEEAVATVPTWFAHRLKRWLRRATGYAHISHWGQTFYLEKPEEWADRMDEQFSLSVRGDP